MVGVHGHADTGAEAVAAEFGCRLWPDLTAMLDDLAPDFAFAFGAHRDMPDIGDALIARGIPFSIEKPGGRTANDVRRLRRRAAGLFVSVPLHYRISAMATALESFVPRPSSGFLSAHVRVNAGSPLRYARSSPWLVDPAAAGGGCMINLAHHPIDLLTWLTGADVVEVSCFISSKFLGLKVEDYAVLNLALSDGTLASIETGYSHPVTSDSYVDFHVSLIHGDFSAARHDQALHVRRRDTGDTRLIPVDWEMKSYFSKYVEATVARYCARDVPVAGLGDLEKTMRVIDAAYLSARERTAIRLDARMD